MKEIIDPVDTEDGLFHDGDPSTGAEGTIVYAKIMNALQGGVISNQQELASVLKEAGIPIDPTKQDQLLTAIKSILGSGTADKAKSADKLSTARKIAGHDFDGTADISISADDVGAVSKEGGDYNKTFKFGRVETLPNEQNPTALFSKGGPDGTITSGVEFNWYAHKAVVGIVRDGSDGAKGFAITLDGNQLMSIDPSGVLRLMGNALSSGTIIGLQNDNRQHFTMANADGSARAYIWKDKGGDGIHITNGADGGGDFVFGKDGHFYAPVAVQAGSSVFGSNGDVSGTLWGGWLSAWLNTQFASANNLAQDAWNKANDAQNNLNNTVRDSRRGPQQYINPGENGIWNGFEVPNGYFSGTKNHTDDGNAKFSEYFYRVQQIYIPAQGWVDTGTL
ncbi:hypothetical protein ACSFCW_11005 [Yokenella regensburgei]|uniref:hypothetical protein n=1 Tax=Yokenella regensburgei TaxID=158877 RepID=UPI003EDA1759